MKRRLIDWFYEVKYFFQRIFRSNHASDRDIFELFPRLAEIILPKLKTFRKKTYAHPGDFVDDENYKGSVGGGQEKWNEYLDEMIFAFEFILADNFMNDKQLERFKKKYGDWELKKPENLRMPNLGVTKEYYIGMVKEYYFDSKMYEAMHERCNNGLKLFGEYFRALWF